MRGTCCLQKTLITAAQYVTNATSLQNTTMHWPAGPAEHMRCCVISGHSDKRCSPRLAVHRGRTRSTSTMLASLCIYCRQMASTRSCLSLLPVPDALGCTRVTAFLDIPCYLCSERCLLIHMTQVVTRADRQQPQLQRLTPRTYRPWPQLPKQATPELLHHVCWTAAAQLRPIVWPAHACCQLSINLVVGLGGGQQHLHPVNQGCAGGWGRGQRHMSVVHLLSHPLQHMCMYDD
jgi:hypothetical protein